MIKHHAVLSKVT